MYQPAMKEDTVRALYRIKRAYHKPMTSVMEELLTTGLRSVNKVRICSICQSEGNNGDCSNCHFGQE